MPGMYKLKNISRCHLGKKYEKWEEKKEKNVKEKKRKDIRKRGIKDKRVK
jgi:hypothetical protein